MKKPGDSAVKKHLRFLLNTVITLCAAAALAAVVMVLSGLRAYIVRTASMAPQIKADSVILVYEKADLYSIVSGDIITFRTSGGAFVTHRVVREDSSGFVTKGDGNDVEDPELVTEENFIGKCVFVLPEAGKLVRFLKSPYGTITAVLVIVLLIAADHLLEKQISDVRGGNSDEQHQ